MIDCAVSEPPQLEKQIRDQVVDKGETLKVKIPFSGTGPFDFKVKKNNRDLRLNDRVQFTTFDDYVILHIKGRRIYLVDRLNRLSVGKSV